MKPRIKKDNNTGGKGEILIFSPLIKNPLLKFMSAFLALIFLFNTICPPAYAWRPGNYGDTSSTKSFLGGFISSYVGSIFSFVSPLTSVISSLASDAVSTGLYYNYYQSYNDPWLTIKWKKLGWEHTFTKGEILPMVAGIVTSAGVNFVSGAIKEAISGTVEETAENITKSIVDNALKETAKTTAQSTITSSLRNALVALGKSFVRLIKALEALFTHPVATISKTLSALMKSLKEIGEKIKEVGKKIKRAGEEIKKAGKEIKSSVGNKLDILCNKIIETASVAAEKISALSVEEVAKKGLSFLINRIKAFIVSLKNKVVARYDHLKSALTGKAAAGAAPKSASAEIYSMFKQARLLGISNNPYFQLGQMGLKGIPLFFLNLASDITIRLAKMILTEYLTDKLEEKGLSRSVAEFLANAFMEAVGNSFVDAVISTAYAKLFSSIVNRFANLFGRSIKVYRTSNGGFIFGQSGKEKVEIKVVKKDGQEVTLEATVEEASHAQVTVKEKDGSEKQMSLGDAIIQGKAGQIIAVSIGQGGTQRTEKVSSIEGWNKAIAEVRSYLSPKNQVRKAEERDAIGDMLIEVIIDGKVYTRTVKELTGGELLLTKDGRVLDPNEVKIEGTKKVGGKLYAITKEGGKEKRIEMSSVRVSGEVLLTEDNRVLDPNKVKTTLKDGKLYARIDGKDVECRLIEAASLIKLIEETGNIFILVDKKVVTINSSAVRIQIAERAKEYIRLVENAKDTYLSRDMSGRLISQNNVIMAGVKAVQNQGIGRLIGVLIKALLLTKLHYTRFGNKDFEEAWKMALAQAVGDIAASAIDNWDKLGWWFAGKPEKNESVEAGSFEPDEEEESPAVGELRDRVVTGEGPSPLNDMRTGIPSLDNMTNEKKLAVLEKRSDEIAEKKQVPAQEASAKQAYLNPYRTRADGEGFLDHMIKKVLVNEAVSGADRVIWAWIANRKNLEGELSGLGHILFSNVIAGAIDVIFRREPGKAKTDLFEKSQTKESEELQAKESEIANLEEEEQTLEDKLASGEIASGSPEFDATLNKLNEIVKKKLEIKEAADALRAEIKAGSVKLETPEMQRDHQGDDSSRAMGEDGSIIITYYPGTDKLSNNEGKFKVVVNGKEETLTPDQVADRVLGKDRKPGSQLEMKVDGENGERFVEGTDGKRYRLEPTGEYKFTKEEAYVGDKLDDPHYNGRLDFSGKSFTPVLQENEDGLPVPVKGQNGNKDVLEKRNFQVFYDEESGEYHLIDEQGQPVDFVVAANKPIFREQETKEGKNGKLKSHDEKGAPLTLHKIAQNSKGDMYLVFDKNVKGYFLVANDKQGQSQAYRLQEAEGAAEALTTLAKVKIEDIINDFVVALFRAGSLNPEVPDNSPRNRALEAHNAKQSEYIGLMQAGIKGANPSQVLASRAASYLDAEANRRFTESVASAINIQVPGLQVLPEQRNYVSFRPSEEIAETEATLYDENIKQLEETKKLLSATKEKTEQVDRLEGDIEANKAKSSKLAEQKKADEKQLKGINYDVRENNLTRDEAIQIVGNYIAKKSAKGKPASKEPDSAKEAESEILSGKLDIKTMPQEALIELAKLIQGIQTIESRLPKIDEEKQALEEQAGSDDPDIILSLSKNAAEKKALGQELVNREAKIKTVESIAKNILEKEKQIKDIEQDNIAKNIDIGILKDDLDKAGIRLNKVESPETHIESEQIKREMQVIKSRLLKIDEKTQALEEQAGSDDPDIMLSLAKNAAEKKALGQELVKKEAKLKAMGDNLLALAIEDTENEIAFLNREKEFAQAKAGTNYLGIFRAFALAALARQHHGQVNAKDFVSGGTEAYNVDRRLNQSHRMSKATKEVGKEKADDSEKAGLWPKYKAESAKKALEIGQDFQIVSTYHPSIAGIPQAAETYGNNQVWALGGTLGSLKAELKQYKGDLVVDIETLPEGTAKDYLKLLYEDTSKMKPEEKEAREKLRKELETQLKETPAEQNKVDKIVKNVDDIIKKREKDSYTKGITYIPSEPPEKKKQVEETIQEIQEGRTVYHPEQGLMQRIERDQWGRQIETSYYNYKFDSATGKWENVKLDKSTKYYLNAFGVGSVVDTDHTDVAWDTKLHYPTDPNVTYDMNLYSVGKGHSPWAGPTNRIVVREINTGPLLQAKAQYRVHSDVVWSQYKYAVSLLVDPTTNEATKEEAREMLKNIGFTDEDIKRGIEKYNAGLEKSGDLRRANRELAKIVLKRSQIDLKGKSAEEKAKYIFDDPEISEFIKGMKEEFKGVVTDETILSNIAGFLSSPKDLKEFADLTDQRLEEVGKKQGAQDAFMTKALSEELSRRFDQTQPVIESDLANIQEVQFYRYQQMPGDKGKSYAFPTWSTKGGYNNDGSSRFNLAQGYTYDKDTLIAMRANALEYAKKTGNVQIKNYLDNLVIHNLKGTNIYLLTEGPTDEHLDAIYAYKTKVDAPRASDIEQADTGTEPVIPLSDVIEGNVKISSLSFGSNTKIDAPLSEKSSAPDVVEQRIENVVNQGPVDKELEKIIEDESPGKKKLESIEQAELSKMREERSQKMQEEINKKMTQMFNQAVGKEEKKIEAPVVGSPKEIKTALKNAGFYDGPIIDNVGPLTKKAIEKFQKANGLEADRKVGPKTWAVLKAYLSPTEVRDVPPPMAQPQTSKTETPATSDSASVTPAVVPNTSAPKTVRQLKPGMEIVTPKGKTLTITGIEKLPGGALDVIAKSPDERYPQTFGFDNNKSLKNVKLFKLKEGTVDSKIGEISPTTSNLTPTKQDDRPAAPPADEAKPETRTVTQKEPVVPPIQETKTVPMVGDLSQPLPEPKTTTQYKEPIESPAPEIKLETRVSAQPQVEESNSPEAVPDASPPETSINFEVQKFEPSAVKTGREVKDFDIGKPSQDTTPAATPPPDLSSAPKLIGDFQPGTPLKLELYDRADHSFGVSGNPDYEIRGKIVDIQSGDSASTLPKGQSKETRERYVEITFEDKKGNRYTLGGFKDDPIYKLRQKSPLPEEYKGKIMDDVRFGNPAGNSSGSIEANPDERIKLVALDRGIGSLQPNDVIFFSLEDRNSYDSHDYEKMKVKIVDIQSGDSASTAKGLPEEYRKEYVEITVEDEKGNRHTLGGYKGHPMDDLGWKSSWPEEYAGKYRVDAWAYRPVSYPAKNDSSVDKKPARKFDAMEQIDPNAGAVHYRPPDTQPYIEELVKVEQQISDLSSMLGNPDTTTQLANLKAREVALKTIISRGTDDFAQDIRGGVTTAMPPTAHYRPNAEETLKAGTKEPEFIGPPALPAETNLQTSNVIKDFVANQDKEELTRIDKESKKIMHQYYLDNGLDVAVKTMTSSKRTELQNKIVPLIDKIVKIDNEFEFFPPKIDLEVKFLSEKRDLAFNSLLKLGIPAIALLREMVVSDSSSHHRLFAAEVLAKIEPQLAIMPVSQALLGDKDSTTRGLMAGILGDLKDYSQAVIPLSQALAEDKDPFVRGCAAKALGSFRDSRAVPLLSKALAEDKDAYVRDETAKALGKIGDSKAAPALLRASFDINSHVRKVSVKALEAVFERKVEATHNLLNKLEVLEKDDGSVVDNRDALGVLQDCVRLNIKFPFRMDLDTLKEVIKNRQEYKSDDNRRLAVVVYNQNDGDKSFYFNKIDSLVQQGFRVMYYEASTVDEVIKAVRAGTVEKPADVIVLGAHSDRTFMGFGDKRYNYINEKGENVNILDPNSVLGFKDEQRLKDPEKGISTALKPGGYVIIEGCSTGEGRDTLDNIANMMRRVFPQAREKGIFAPVSPGNVENIQFQFIQKGKVEDLKVKYDVPSYQTYNSYGKKVEPDLGNRENSVAMIQPNELNEEKQALTTMASRIDSRDKGQQHIPGNAHARRPPRSLDEAIESAIADRESAGIDEQEADFPEPKATTQYPESIGPPSLLTLLLPIAEKTEISKVSQVERSVIKSKKPDVVEPKHKSPRQAWSLDSLPPMLFTAEPLRTKVSSQISPDADSGWVSAKKIVDEIQRADSPSIEPELYDSVINLVDEFERGNTQAKATVKKLIPMLLPILVREDKPALIVASRARWVLNRLDSPKMVEVYSDIFKSNQLPPIANRILWLNLRNYIGDLATDSMLQNFQYVGLPAALVLMANPNTHTGSNFDVQYFREAGYKVVADTVSNSKELEAAVSDTLYGRWYAGSIDAHGLSSGILLSSPKGLLAVGITVKDIREKGLLKGYDRYFYRSALLIASSCGALDPYTRDNIGKALGDVLKVEEVQGVAYPTVSWLTDHKENKWGVGLRPFFPSEALVKYHPSTGVSEYNNNNVQSGQYQR